MPFGQSPWEDASAAVSGVAQNFNQVNIALARMKYQRAVQEQRLALEMGKQALAREMQEKNIGHLDVMNEHYKLQDKLTNERMAAADQVGMAARVPYDIEARQARQPYRADMSQGPTLGDAEQIRLADSAAAEPEALANLAQFAQRSRALYGHGMTGFEQHNVPPGDFVLGPTGRLVGQGPPKVQMGAAGATPVYMSGPSVGERAGVTLPQRINTANDLKISDLRALVDGAMKTEALKNFGRGGDVSTNEVYKLTFPLLKQRLTSASGNAPAPSGGRIRVRGPKGETGTIEAGDPLPDGWSHVE